MFVFSLLSWGNSLYMLATNPWAYVCTENILSSSVTCHFSDLIVILMRGRFKLWRSPFIIVNGFFFLCVLKETFAYPKVSRIFFSVVFCRLTSMTHLKLIFLYGLEFEGLPLYVVTWLFQHNMLKGYLYSLWIALMTLLNITCPSICWPLSGVFMLSYYHIVLNTVAL